MHIKDYNDAMTFFRTYDNVASKGKWKEFVDEMEFDDMLQEPRTMAQGGRIIGKPGGLVEPGVMYYGNVKVIAPENFVTIEGLTNYLPFSKGNLEDAYSRLDRPSEIRNALKSSGIKLIKHQKKPGGMKYNIFKIPTETQIDNFWENYTKIINKKGGSFGVPSGIMEPFKNEVMLNL